MKASVLYYSKSGNTEKMAEIIAEGMREEGATAKIFSLENIDETFVRESRCVIVGTPTYLADMAGGVKAWLDERSGKYALAGKLGGAFATADYLHGGADIAVQSVLRHLMVKGMLLYSGGGSCGKPVIHLGPVALKSSLEESEEVFRIYGRRMASKAKELFERE